MKLMKKAWHKDLLHAFGSNLSTLTVDESILKLHGDTWSTIGTLIFRETSSLFLDLSPLVELRFLQKVVTPEGVDKCIHFLFSKFEREWIDKSVRIMKVDSKYLRIRDEKKISWSSFVKDIRSRVNNYLSLYKKDHDHRLARGLLVGFGLEEYSGCYFDVREMLNRLPKSEERSYQVIRKRLEKKFTEHIRKEYDTFLMDLDRIANSSLFRYLPTILELRSKQLDRIVNAKYTLYSHVRKAGPYYLFTDLMETSYGRMVVDSLDLVEPFTEDELADVRDAFRELDVHVNW